MSVSHKAWSLPLPLMGGGGGLSAAAIALAPSGCEAVQPAILGWVYCGGRYWCHSLGGIWGTWSDTALVLLAHTPWVLPKSTKAAGWSCVLLFLDQPILYDSSNQQVLLESYCVPCIGPDGRLGDPDLPRKS